MSWHDVYGHDDLVERFRRSVVRGRLATTFLFVGPPGVGKRTFALQLAKALLCEGHSAQALEACGRCEACVQVAALTHPDLILVGKPHDKNFIPVETFIGDREHRMQQGLCHDISLKPFRGGHRIAIIDDADLMNLEGANCLLKTLEEPPPRSVLILIGTSEQKQLPTIRSRSQIVRFAPLPPDVVAKLLLEKGLVENAADAQRLAEISRGSLQRAIVWTETELCEFRTRFLDYLPDRTADTVRFTKELAKFVEAAGKDAPLRRERMRQVMSFATEFYGQLMRGLSGATVDGDAVLTQSVNRGAATWDAGVQAAGACLERCLQAQAQVDANANQATLLECWIDDLAELSRGNSLASMS